MSGASSPEIPGTMQRIEFESHGEPEVLKPRTVEVPRPGPGQVLIRAAAVGVNRPDVLQRKGLYPPPLDASPHLGLEVAGTVVAVGEGVHTPAVGEVVCALTPGGAYAEYVLTPAAQCLPVPAGVSLVEAAAIPETYMTVWSNLFMRAGLKPGETLLVHGGSSGIGTTAIQLAKAFGANVIVTAGTREKCNWCRELGADVAVDYRLQDFYERIMEVTDDLGVDVILDMIGGKYFQKNLQCLKDEGRLVIIAVLGGAKAEIPLAEVMRRRLTVTGSTLRPRPVEFKAAVARELVEQVWPKFAAGQLKVPVYATFPLAQADQAHRLMESSEHTGKIVLTVDA